MRGVTATNAVINANIEGANSEGAQSQIVITEDMKVRILSQTITF